MEAWLLNGELRDPRATGDVTKQCIYKFPEWLKDGILDTTAYTPEIVSFGPYHWKSPSLAEMDKHKFRRLIRNSPQRIAEFLVKMGEILPQVQVCYEIDPLETISEDEFRKMLVLDGCFMLDYLRALWYGGEEMNNDPVFSMRTKMEVIGRDLIKLENQLPIIVLQSLLTVQYGELNPVRLDLTRMVLKAVSPIWVSSELLTEQQSNERRESVAESIKDQALHCLDIFRSNLLYGLTSNPTTTEIVIDTGATTLPSVATAGASTSEAAVATTPTNVAAGARTEGTGRRNREQHPTLLYGKSNTNSVEDLRVWISIKIRDRRPFWDIKFDKRRRWLRIPQIQINTTSKTIFLNLIAYEQCHFISFQDMNITDYIAFMSTLVNTGADVDRLHKAGIIIHQLGNNDEVAALFNSLVTKACIVSEDGRLRGIHMILNDYCGLVCSVVY